EHQAGNVDSAILLTNNCTDTSWFHDAAAAANAICFTKGRIRFLNADGMTAGSPTQGQAFFYFGDKIGAFVKRFETIGFVRLREPHVLSPTLAPAIERPVVAILDNPQGAG